MGKDMLFKAQNVGKDLLLKAQPPKYEERHARESRKNLLIMARDMHAQESRNDGSRKTHLQKEKAYEGFTFYEFSFTQAQSTEEHPHAHSIFPTTISKPWRKKQDPWRCPKKHGNG